MRIPEERSLVAFVQDLLGPHAPIAWQLLGGPIPEPVRWSAEETEGDWLGFGGIGFIGTGSTTGMTLGFDASAYAHPNGDRDDWEHAPEAGCCVELAVIVIPPHGAHFAPAFKRAAAAWASLAQHPALRAAPVPLSDLDSDGPSVLLVDYEGNRSLSFQERRGLWVALRTSKLSSNATIAQLEEHARSEFPELVPILLEAATRVRGAVDARTRNLSTDTLTGWIGEYIVHREFPTLRWVGGNEAIDFLSSDGSGVEVKATASTQGGLMHLSPTQVGRIATHPTTVRGVRVPAEAVSDLKQALIQRMDTSPAASVHGSWNLPLSRLAIATGLTWADLTNRLPDIRDALGSLNSHSVDQEVHSRLDLAVWNALHAAHAGVSLPLRGV